MSFSISPWNIIKSMKAVDEWQNVVNSNIVGSARTGYKAYDSYFGGGNTYIIKPPGLTDEAKQIAEQVLNTHHTFIDFSQGELIKSWDWTHTAVQGDGFFMTSKVLGNPDPLYDIQYTRDGEWHIDDDGFLRTKEGLYVMDGSYIPGSPTNSSTAIPPWIGSVFDPWFAREEIVVENTSGRFISRDTVVEVEFDAAKLIATGQILDPANLNDVRIGYYQDPPGNPAGWSELPREIIPSTLGTANTVLRFRLQDDLNPGDILTDKYFIYYQGPTGAPAAAGGNYAIGLTDPVGGVDNFGGFFNPDDDLLDVPGNPRSVEDWVNEFGAETWKAGLPDSPSDTWLGAKAGHINYTKDGVTGYDITTTTSGSVSVNNHAAIVAEEIYRESDGMGGWRFVDRNGTEIMITDMINGTNFAGTRNPNYDFRLNNTMLNLARNNFNPASTRWQTFRPSDILGAGWLLPALTGEVGPGFVGNYPYSALPGPQGSWNGEPFLSPANVTDGDSNFDADDTVWAGDTSFNDYQFTLLRHPIYVSTEGVTRDTLGPLNEIIGMDGFVDHDVSVFLRRADGSLVNLYQDGTFNNNLWTTSTFDPYNELQVGTNWIEVYASHEVASPPNVPGFTDNASGYVIGTAEPQMEANGWDVGGSDPSAWQITDPTGAPYLAAGAHPSYGNIIYSTTNSDNYIFRGDDTWDDYWVEATIGVANTDDDMVMLWARVQNDTTVAEGPRSGYAFMIQRPADLNGVGYGGHQIAIARFDAGVPTILANEHTHPALMNWFNTQVVPSGSAWSQQHWNFRLEVDGSDISVYAGSRGTSATVAGAIPGAPLVTVTDATYPTGKFAMKTISQVAWFDNIEFSPTPDRKAGVRVDNGTASQRGIQSIDAFTTNLPRYYTDGINVYDRFGNPNVALTDANSNTLEGGATGDNRYRTSNADGNLNAGGDNDGLRDYDPGSPLNVSTLNNVPILDTRIVQYGNPGVETRISTDGNLINQGAVDPYEYDGSNTWNEYIAEFDWGYSVPGAGGDIYTYMRHLDDNNWIRMRHTEGSGLFLEKSVGGVVSNLASIPGYAMADPVTGGDHIRFEVEGRNLRVYRGGTTLFNVTDNSANPILTGRFALGNTRSAWYDNMEVRQMPLQRFDTWIEGFMQPTGPDDILNQMNLILFPDNQGLVYEKNLGAVYFQQTQTSGAPIVKKPGVDGAGNLHVYTLEASNVDTANEIARLGAIKDVFDVLSKQFLVYIDTVDSTLRLFR